MSIPLKGKWNEWIRKRRNVYRTFFGSSCSESRESSRVLDVGRHGLNIISARGVGAIRTMTSICFAHQKQISYQSNYEFHRTYIFWESKCFNNFATTPPISNPIGKHYPQRTRSISAIASVDCFYSPFY